MPTNDSNVTRDNIIQMAHEDIGAVAEGETLTSDQLAGGIRRLNMIVREEDLIGKYLWTISATPSTLTLVANTFVYTSANGLPTTMLELIKATYRNASGSDNGLKILTTEQYEDIGNKYETGDPESVFLSEHKTVASKTLIVHPTLEAVNSQSVVTGTDAVVYRCIRNHVADSTNKPITGANYLLYWEAGGSGPSVWATDTEYTAPQHLRLWFKRPLYDFDAAGDNPDYPQGWANYLTCRLAESLAPSHRLSSEEKRDISRGVTRAYARLFPSQVPKTTEIHNKTEYM